MAYSTISKPSLYFNTKLYTGTGSSNAITGVGFQPDWVWIKNRSANANHHAFDVVRGVTKDLSPNQNVAEATDTQKLTTFGTDGFTVGTNGNVNGNGNNIVSWNWKAGGSGSSNSDGSVTTSVSVNTTAGFSIVSYTGTGSVGTFGHGLGAKPNVMIQKKRSGSASWTVYHDKVDANPSHKYLYLNSNAVPADYADHFNDTEPTSSVFTLGTDTSVNGSSATNIMYCFVEKKGYSKFGSYKGNDNADGTFVYTGFKPAWIIRKNIDGGVTESWFMEDNKRNTFNPANEWLAADASSAEGANNFDTDFLSNGFKMRTNNHGTNKGSTNYIYMAFAEEPLVANVGNSIPATAR